MTTQLREENCKQQKNLPTAITSIEVAKANTTNTSEIGNTDTISNNEVIKLVSKSVENYRSRKFCMTLNNYGVNDFNTLTQTFKKLKYLYIIGKEVGDSGTRHLQIYIESKSAIKFKTIKKIDNRFHIEKSKGTRRQNYIYCSKEGDFGSNITLKVTRDDIKEVILLKRYNNVEWRPFQKEILGLLDGETDERKIRWYYDKTGNIGKSYLIKYICIKYTGVIIGDGKKQDIFNQINTSIDNGIIPQIIILDIPRHNKDYINYGCIEQIKDGCIYSGKYEGGQCIYDYPKVLIFSNDLPELYKWSKDRYFIKNLENNTLYDIDLLRENGENNYDFISSDEDED